ncbi:MAG: 16S rRNA (cytidine(1402)-2'-O)-methyltransferase, partial [Puniceicoccales bacterium]|nr:16S rRNA (cytidine(1402)-2'-O)-methyltransferase [Puniceicoccales bacterium]
MSDDSGKFPPGLYVVATPIGNLGDISQRARDLLANCDLLACEDTRVTGKLLAHFAISAKMLSYREENERDVAIGLADRVTAGLTVAIACDAGTPAISDPGFRAVRECRRRGLSVYAIPGPSASIAALSASGLPSDRFLFL